MSGRWSSIHKDKIIHRLLQGRFVSPRKRPRTSPCEWRRRLRRDPALLASVREGAANGDKFDALVASYGRGL